MSSHSLRDDEPTRKLSFFPLPAKSPPPGMLTPPLRSSASVPFRWEEAPGRPRPSAHREANDKPRTVRRSLELPPRLLVGCAHDDHSRITSMPSPTTVLDGPDTCRSLSYGTSFRSFHKERAGYFGSRRWGSFRKNFGNKELVGVEVEGTSYFSSSLALGGRRNSGGDTTGGGGYNAHNKMKMRRRASLLSVSGTLTSHLWGGIYESLKQVVSWKRERSKTTK